MELLEFPVTIATAQEALLQSEQAARDWELDYQTRINEVDCAIAFDPDLKNEQQRKAARFTLLQEPSIVSALSTLHQLQDEVKRKRIALELLQNQFTVAKLVERRSIAISGSLEL